MKKKDANRYPKGWTRKQIEALAEYYDNQKDEAAVAEAAYRKRQSSLIEVPIRLLPEVRKLLARRAG